MELYSYKYGLATTEQNLLLALDDFLTVDLNWTKIDTITDTTSDRNYVWRSNGSRTWKNAGGEPITIHVRAYNDEWICAGYRTYINSTTYTFQLYNNPNTHVDLSESVLRYWFYGNDDFVCCLIHDPTTGEPVVAYLGLIRSYYDAGRDDYPMLIKGSRYQYYSWYDNENAYMHNCTTSGAQTFESVSWWNFLQYEQRVRHGCHLMMPLVLVNQNSSNQEMRGEPYGVYQVNGDLLPMYGAISTASGVYLTIKFDSQGSECNAFGPVASGVDAFSMWDNGDVYAS
jgi:hypothetical protein